MTSRRKVPSQPAGAATGIEDASAAGCDRIHETSLAGQILPGACHGPEAFDIPMRMSGIGLDLLHPDALLDHTSIVATGDLYYEPHRRRSASVRSLCQAWAPPPVPTHAVTAATRHRQPRALHTRSRTTSPYSSSTVEMDARAEWLIREVPEREGLSLVLQPVRPVIGR